MSPIIDIDDLDSGENSRQFIGADHDVPVSMFLVHSPPGNGPSLHRHPYDEILVVQEGKATVTAEGEERVVRGGEVVIVPAGVAHAFVNTGDGPLRQLDIHLSASFDTEWLSDG